MEEEKLLLRSNFSSFPQYFQYIPNFKSQISYSFFKCGCLIYCFPLFRKSDMSKYRYLEVSESPLSFEITRVTCMFMRRNKQKYLSRYSSYLELCRLESLSGSLVLKKEALSIF